MPPYKRQHFLPAVYLKHFSIDQANPQRNSPIWRFDGIKSVQVPVVSQCAEDYFYSKSRAEQAEKMFGASEEEYLRCLNNIKAAGKANKADDLKCMLLLFELHLRNASFDNLTGKEELDAYSQRLTMFFHWFLGRKDFEANPTSDEIVAELNTHWKLELLRAPRGPSFVTSNNPSLWLTHNPVKHTLQIGLLPVTPESAILIYDTRYIRRVTGPSDGNDIYALNHLQAANGDIIYSSVPLPRMLCDKLGRALNRGRTRGSISPEDWKFRLIKPKTGFLSFIQDVATVF